MSVTDFSPFLAIHIDLPRNRKTYALARLLSEKRTSVVGMLVSFWAWALENALDGKLDPDPNLLADIMEWEHDKTLLVNALVSARWLDVDGNGHWSIHDWDDHTGDFQAKRAARLKQNRDAQARHRAELKLISDSKPILLPEKCKTTKHSVSMTSALPQHDVSTMSAHNGTERNGTIIITKEIYIKKKYGPFENVLLSDDEYEKLKTRFNNSLQEKIEELSVGIASKGYKYKSHYATILNWARKHEKEGGQNGTNRQNPRRSTRLPDRNTGYTEPPPDPALAAAVRAAHPDSPPT